MKTSTESGPLHQRLGAEFRRRIEAGEWPEGQPVPSEAQLCEEFGTSRGPVRQALAQLRAEGHLVGGRGRPPVARRVTPSQPFASLMSFTQWARSIGREPGQYTVEVARRRAGPDTAARLGLDEGAPVVDLVRLRHLDGVPAMVERSTFVLEAGAHLFAVDPDAGSVYEALIARGVDLHHARHTIDAIAADPEDAELLDVAIGHPLLRVRRLAYTGDGTPVEYADDRYLPSMATFTIENTVGGRTVAGREHSEPPADPAAPRSVSEEPQ
ncbi:GntR family transcriptional regulator [Streptomyces sp. VRA16 Mangrove soil]|uniref:GntR family transcriptional regulator n=1 Tax=Streptomyces sp. VRA16 Mangrove soil TaxID=2817434 RepID=UPI001A9DEEA1|nr:GntR family transcriptional regulator [Streptomyces sp. VRA16 Mangrove soil]MBO1330590.1 GntR family transcriptional regulator [Streptomyces sp. VRA16 Mangrove soil]